MTRRSTMLVLVVACCAAAAVGLAAGPSGWRWRAVADLLAGDDIIAGLRAPRVALSAAVGACLAVAGVAMQTLLRNELADPYILGVSGGASVGAVASLAAFPALPPGPGAAAGAVGATLLVRAIARGPHDPVRLLLAGVTVGSLLGGVTGLLCMLAPRASAVRSAMFWLFGGLGTPPWCALAWPVAALVLGGAWLYHRSERLDRLVLGEDVATSLGVAVAPVRRGAFAVAVGLTALAVAVGGLIGFVGLLGPHMARRLVGATHRAALPVAALCGALIVMSADVVARVAFSPREIPVGLVTAMVGGPAFVALLGRAPRW